MGHNLKVNEDGKRAMIYNEQGGQPWHKLGTPVSGPMTTEVAKSVFPFTYSKEPLHRPDGSKIETHDSIVISDTNKIMGIGGVSTTIIQPEEVCAFGQELFETSGVLCETAGALGDGERIWLLLHTPDYKYEVVKNDEHRMYVLITNAYDYTAALEARYTDIRAVCENTVNAATSGSPALIKLKHTSNMNMAAEIFKGYLRSTETFKEAMQVLAKHPINDQVIHEFETSMFGDLDKTEEGRGRTILQNKLTKFEELLFKGKGTEIPGVVGSAYGLFNAYTEFQDWFSVVRGTTDRTHAILFGQASKDKSRALGTVLQLVRA